MVFFYILTQLSFGAPESIENINKNCIHRYPRSVCLAKSGCHWKQNTCYGYYKNDVQDNDKTLLSNPKEAFKHLRSGQKIKYDSCEVINEDISKILGNLNLQDNNNLVNTPAISRLVKKCDLFPKCHWNNLTQKCEQLTRKRKYLTINQ